MMSWKKTAVLGAGIGMGIVFSALLIVLAWYKWAHRTKSWDKTAITAEYDGLDTEGSDHDLTFEYTLINNTDRDYRLDQRGPGVHFGGRLRQENSVELHSSEDEFSRFDYPVYVPEHGRVRLLVHVKFPYPTDYPSDGSRDEQHDWQTKVAKFVVKQMGNLSGFVIMDDANRYEIDLPSGWEKRSLEPLSTHSN